MIVQCNFIRIKRKKPPLPNEITRSSERSLCVATLSFSTSVLAAAAAQPRGLAKALLSSMSTTIVTSLLEGDMSTRASTSGLLGLWGDSCCCDGGCGGIMERGLFLTGGGISTPTETSIATLLLKKAAVNGWFWANALESE